jgi:hypothetical protein
VILAGCANPIQGARIGLLTAEKFQIKTVDQWKAYDRQHQLDIVAAAKSEAEGKAALLEYRTKVQTPVVKALQGLYLGYVAADEAVALAAMGKSKIDLAAVVATLFDLVEKTKNTLVELGVPLGGL